MKNRDRILSTVYFLAVFLVPVSVLAENPWHIRSSVTVSKKGMMEAVLLPGLHEQAGPDKLDVTLTGPDGKPRAFELYMHGKSVTKSVDLTPKNVRLTDAGAFVWEALAPDMRIETLTVIVGDTQFIGKVRVEGQSGKKWQTLADNEALYQTDGVFKGEIKITPGRYSAIRLTFSGLDSRNTRAVIPIKSVTATAVSTGKPSAGMTIPVLFIQSGINSGKDGMIEIKGKLPGSGISMKTLSLMTQAPFLGDWQIGREDIRDGRLVFNPVISGTVTEIASDRPSLCVNLDRRWKGSSLTVRLFPQGRYIGAVTAMNLEAEVPRVLFSADTEGVYHLSTGTGASQAITEESVNPAIDTCETVRLSGPETNPSWKVAGLVETVSIKGGPFTGKGYAWRSDVTVKEPGYYRLRLHQAADLDAGRYGIRIVKDGVQVPFLFSSEKEKRITLSPVAEYHEKTNETTWDVSLPKGAAHLKTLTITASGMFRRDVDFMIRKPGNTGWKTWQSAPWVNDTAGETKLSVPLAFTGDSPSALEIRISHKDNKPFDLSSIDVSYASVDLLFIAKESGIYQVFGGNPDAKAASYDLTLIENRLLDALPTDLDMPEPMKLKPAPLKDNLMALFQGNSWGLYIILGLVTAILMGVVMKLFPKSPGNDL